MYIRESLVAPVEKVSQRRVIHSQHMEYGGVDVMIGNDLFGGFVATSSVEPMTCPPGIPPPAIHSVMAPGL